MIEVFRYLIIGGGMAADAAVRGIRQIDSKGRIGLFSKEPDPPYNRPPLSKGLWKRTPLSRIWRRTADLNVELYLSSTITQNDPANKRVIDHTGGEYSFEKLLLATGGDPIRLSAGSGPSDQERVIYFRTLADYHRLRALTETGSRFAVIGGGFIGSEIAAALASLGKQVTIIFPESGIGARVLPQEISAHLNQTFQQNGVQVLSERLVQSLQTSPDAVTLWLDSGQSITADGVVAGLGIRPNVSLALQAGLDVNHGITVDAELRTSHPDIFAAGDVISFYNPVLDQRMRVEHEEHANLTGMLAGQGMAGELQPYHHLPAVYSSLFGISYDAVGELNPHFEIVYDWQEPNQRGVVYYLCRQEVRGVLLWNQPKGLDQARELIASRRSFQPSQLKGIIAF